MSVVVDSSEKILCYSTAVNGLCRGASGSHPDLSMACPKDILAIDYGRRIIGSAVSDNRPECTAG